MSKLGKLSEFKVVDNTTGTIIAQYMCGISPHATKLGHVIYVPFGITELSELNAKGISLMDEKDAGKMVRQAYGLSENAFTKRGMDWNTPELRERYSVYQDGVEQKPALSERALINAAAKKAKALAKAQAVAPVMPIIPQPLVTPEVAPVVAQPIQPLQAVAQPTPVTPDTTQNRTVEDEKLIGQIKTYLSSGVTESQIAVALKERLKDDFRANQLIAKATAPVEQIVPQKPAFTFELPKTSGVPTE